MNVEQARFNMVEQQIRPWEVLDDQVLTGLKQIKRENFVAPAYQALAFADVELPLSHAQQTMWQPRLEARAVQALELQASDRVLEIGTGSGYVTALMALFAQHVYSVEIHAEQLAQAKHHLAQAQVQNVTLIQGNGLQGAASHAPYNAILVGGSLPEAPAALLTQLAPLGRLFVVVGQAPVMQARLYRKQVNGDMAVSTLFDVSTAALLEAPEPSSFAF